MNLKSQPKLNQLSHSKSLSTNCHNSTDAKKWHTRNTKLSGWNWNKKLNFLMNEAYPLISHGSLYRNTPCEWHPPNPAPKGYPRKQGKGLICINLWLTQETKRREWRKRVTGRWILITESCWEERWLVLLSTKWSWKKAMVAQRKKSHNRTTQIRVPVPLEAIRVSWCKSSINC